MAWNYMQRYFQARNDSCLILKLGYISANEKEVFIGIMEFWILTTSSVVEERSQKATSVVTAQVL